MRHLPALASLAAALLSAAAHAAPAYLLTPIDMDCASALNRDATVVGMAIDQAAVYKDGVVRRLDTLGGHFSWATAVNDRGRLVGGSLDGNADDRAFVSHGRAMRPLLPDLEGTSAAHGINNGGQVVGWAVMNEGQHAFLYDAGQLIDLGTLGGPSSLARGINNAGQVVGESFTQADSPLRAFLYENGSMKDLGTLGGNTSIASAINDAGVIVGHSNLVEDGPVQAFIHRDGTMQGLGRLHGTKECRATAINEHAEVVGNCLGRLAPSRAFFWRRGRMHDLTELLDPVSGAGWTLQYANGINDAGQIAGCGVRETVEMNIDQAFLLTPM
jgi:probable HAF family extracellular repeat protein